MPVILMASTLFLSAFLLFWCQPMVAKMMLPFLGGSASVWTTCVLFFQTMLLAGYVYAHWLGKFHLRRQIITHVLLMLAAFVFLPIRLSAETAGDATVNPVRWLLVELLATSGVPFFVLSTTAPLVQNWLSKTKLESQRDPYFLYSASNAGSLLALLVFPLIIEPKLGIDTQSSAWAAGYGALLLMVGSVAGVSLKYVRHETAFDEPVPSVPVISRLHWVAAAFVPSALMLAVTNHISVNLAPVPFLWILPLATYLLTWILAFAKSTPFSSDRVSKYIPVVLLILFPITTASFPVGRRWNWLLIAGHIVILFAGGLLCHSVLASRRPHPRQLTEFYFWIALGGALGGVFAAIVAPALFSTVFEYPLLFASIALFREKRDSEDVLRNRDSVYTAALALAAFATWFAFRKFGVDVTQNHIAAAVANTAFLLVVFMFRKHHARFAACLTVLVLAYSFALPEFIEKGERMYVVRNFFGVKKVLFDLGGNRRKLLHGDTLHGLESQDPAKAGLALSYYHPTGPAGDVMRILETRPPQHIGVAGLGAGTMAAYANALRHITFFDVDPQVAFIARGFFTFTRRCGDNCDVVLGDGRLAIQQYPDGEFDLLMLDAFSSDSIPSHLVSREAVQIYLRKLKPDGLMLFHVSNRYLKVEQLVASLIQDAGLVGLVRNDNDESIYGKTGSDYVVAARAIEHLNSLPDDESWYPVDADGVAPWTDDYSNLLGIVRWW